MNIMAEKITTKKSILGKIPNRTNFPSDYGTTIQSIVFNLCSIKPNPFIVKQPDVIHRL